MASLFRSFSISKRVPDHLIEISERIYAFDSCLSTSMKTEKECKTYLASAVKSLHSFHPGASFMVFNFREGEQMSLLSDILMNYDIVVVDYPQHYTGYPLLPLEMIHCFLRSSDSWLSLEGQKNVILMHCESGGWPVLAFMIAGLLLYRKQFSGEKKTLDMVYKKATKQLLSSVISPINPQASQLRYLQYITKRDLASEWPPSDAPVIIDCLILKNLPLFDRGKGCTPVVRVYGQDTSVKDSRSARVLFSSSMEDAPALKYSKEESEFVKLELRCEIQGDVFLECIHLHDDLASEEILFKVMFHTGFIQSNLLSLESVDTDVPWNTKLPKEFKAEVLFRDMNEIPENITMELGGGNDFHDSENEFFEVEEIFTTVTENTDTKGLDGIIVPELKLLNSKNKDCTLRNGSPRWDLEAEETEVMSSTKIIPDEENYQTVLESKFDKMSASSSKNNDVEEIDHISSKQNGLDEGHYLVSEPESDKMSTSSKNNDVEEIDVVSSKQIGLDEGNYLVSEPESDIMSTSSKNIDLEENEVTSSETAPPEGNYQQVLEAESDMMMSTKSRSISIEEIDVIPSKHIAPEKGNHQPVSELESDTTNTSSTNIDVTSYGNYRQVLEVESDLMSTLSKLISVEETDAISSKHIAPENGNHPPVSVLESDITDNSLENIDVTSSNTAAEGSYKQGLEAKSDTVITTPKSASDEENDVISSKHIAPEKRNHQPVSVLESDETDTLSENIDVTSSQIAPTEGNNDQVLEAKSDMMTTTTKPISDDENDFISSKHIAPEKGTQPVSEVQSDATDTLSECIDVSSSKIAPTEGNYEQVLEAKPDIMITTSKPISNEESDFISSKHIAPEKGPQPVSEVQSDATHTLSESIDVISSKIAPTERKYEQVLEAKPDMMITTSKPISDEENDVIPSKHIAPEKGTQQPVSELQSDVTSTTSKNIVVVDSCGSELQDVKVEIEPKHVAPSPAKPKLNKKNKWQEITAKTIKQQRVISQWVPRVKTPESNKPKAPVYKWVPKGPATPAEDAEGE